MNNIKEVQKFTKLLLSDLQIFIFALARNWLFWIFLVLDLIALIIQFINPDYKLPYSYYIGFAVIGFMWSSFQVFRDLLVNYKKLIPGEVKLVSSLDLSFVEGNEYTFSIEKPYDIEMVEYQAKKDELSFRVDERGVAFVNEKIYYEMPTAKLEINIRIENTGNLPVDILDIEMKTDDTLGINIASGFMIYLRELKIDNNIISFPLHVNVGDIIVLIGNEKITNNILANNAQFAAAFRTIPKKFRLNIVVEYLDENKKSKFHKKFLDISCRPLIDIYVNQWRYYEQIDYLRLAGFD